MTMEYVGDLIRKRRQAVGMSTKDLGNAIGKSDKSINDYEAGRTDIKLSILNRIAETLGTTVAGLLIGEKKPAAKNSTEIRIYQLDDRMVVAQILVKNGYTVSQVKRSNGDGRTVQYRLKLEENEDNLKLVK